MGIFMDKSECPSGIDVFFFVDDNGGRYALVPDTKAATVIKGKFLNINRDAKMLN
jgi:hypothetical protein